MLLLTDPDDYDTMQTFFEFYGATCEVCGEPLALDGICDWCADDLYEDSYSELDEAFDQFIEQGGEG